MFKRSIVTRALCCAAAALACSANVLAETRTGSSFIDITNFGWELIDLDPNDGITPALTITSQLVVDGSYYDTDYNNSSYDLQHELQSYGSTAVNGTRGSASATLDASSSHLAANLSSDSHYYTTAIGRSAASLYFDLTPSTGVLFSARGISGVSASNIESSYVYVNSRMGGWLGDRTDGFNQFDKSFYLNTSNGTDSGALSRSGDYFLSGYLHTNRSAASGVLDFSHYSGVQFNGPTPAVPEPETYAMLLAGLALVGAGARRRARR